MKKRQSLDEILVRASAVMYPDQPPKVVGIDSVDADGVTPLHKAVGVHTAQLSHFAG